MAGRAPCTQIPWGAWLGFLPLSSVQPDSGLTVRGVSERGSAINQGLMKSRIGMHKESEPTERDRNHVVIEFSIIFHL